MCMDSHGCHNGQEYSVFYYGMCVFEHRFLSSVTPAESVNMEQSREKLEELKHALRALGFNKSVQ